MSAAIAQARAAYPPPWVVGWNADSEGNWSVEVNRRVSYARFERRVVATGMDDPRGAPPEVMSGRLGGEGEK